MTTMVEIVKAQNISNVKQVSAKSRFNPLGNYCVVEMMSGSLLHVGSRYDTDLEMQVFYAQDVKWVGVESADFNDIVKYLEGL